MNSHASELRNTWRNTAVNCQEFYASNHFVSPTLYEPWKVIINIEVCNLGGEQSREIPAFFQLILALSPGRQKSDP